MKVKLYIQAEKSHWTNGWELREPSTFEFKSDTLTTYVTISQVYVDVDTPELNVKELTLVEVEQLKEQYKKEQADSQMRLNEIDEKIQKLLCIEQDLPEMLKEQAI